MNRAIRDEELSTVLMALRFWQQHGHQAADEIRAIGESDESTVLSNEGIDVLCDRLNAGPSSAQIVVEVLAGGVRNIYGDTAAVDCLVLDWDTDGVDAERLTTIDGDEAFAFIWSTNVDLETTEEVYSAVRDR
jgi:hypothetical protein